MKLKGVNPIAQHIEKIVLGITALALLGVISMQFVSQPNKVDTGTRKVSPDQIYNELASSASALQSQITDQSPSLPIIAPVDLVARYNKAFEANTGSFTQLSASLGNGVDIASALGTTFEDTAGRRDLKISAMPVPATSTPLATSMWGTLDPYAVLALPEYEAFVSTAQPFDFPSVTIEADFSGSTLRDILDGNGDYDGVPRLFWVSTGMAIMGLDAQRQELMPDGSWSAASAIATPPGTPTPINAVSKDDGLVRLNQIIAAAQSVSSQVMRPQFPPTISGPLWQAPSDSIGSQALGLTETQRLQRQLARFTAELERLNNPTKNTRATRQTASRGGGGKTRSTGSSANRPSANTDANAIKIERLETQISSIEDDLESLGVGTDLAGASVTSILDQEFVQLWAHDMGVEPGATYRYRTRAVLNNPYFRKGPYLDEESEAQQALTIEPFVSGDWSEWSEPVAVGAKEFFFITDASQPVIGERPPQARAELYSMYYGFYRRSSSTITPGQHLVGDMRLPKELFLIDTDSIDADEVASYIDSVNLNEEDKERPAGLSSAPDRLSVDLDSYLVQIALDPLTPSTAEDAQALRLIFRLPDGTLEHRVPATDRNRPLYSQAQSSASKASRSQLRPTGQMLDSAVADLFKSVEP